MLLIWPAPGSDRLDSTMAPPLALRRDATPNGCRSDWSVGKKSGRQPEEQREDGAVTAPSFTVDHRRVFLRGQASYEVRFDQAIDLLHRRARSDRWGWRLLRNYPLDSRPRAKTPGSTRRRAGCKRQSDPDSRRPYRARVRRRSLAGVPRPPLPLAPVERAVTWHL